MKKYLWPSLFLLALLALAWQVGRSQERGDLTFPEAFINSRDAAQVKRELATRKPDLRTLALEKRSAARSMLKWRFDEFAAGKTTIADFMLDAAEKLREAELAVCTTKAERLEALEQCWLVAKAADMINKAKFDAGTIGPANYYPVLYTRLQMEYDLVKARSE